MATARKLEQDLNTMVETFYSLLRAAYITEEKDESVKQDRKIPGELIEVLAEKLVVAGQSVLTLIAELKRQALLSDFPALNKMIDERDAQHEALREKFEQATEEERTRLRCKDQTGEELNVDEEHEAELRRLYILAQEVPLKQ